MLQQSETLLAMSETDLLISRRDERLQYIMKIIEYELQRSFPLLFEGMRSSTNFFSDILIPANNLAMKMKTSTTKYIVHMTTDIRLSPPAKRFIATSRFVDIVTNKTIRVDSPITYEDDEFFGEALFQMEPSLRRINEISPSITLRSEAWLIDLYHPLGKRSS